MNLSRFQSETVAGHAALPAPCVPAEPAGAAAGSALVDAATAITVAVTTMVSTMGVGRGNADGSSAAKAEEESTLLGQGLGR